MKFFKKLFSNNKEKNTIYNETYDSGIQSLTFEWKDGSVVPLVSHNNISPSNINDVFVMTAENLISASPKYYEILQRELKQVYDYMYNNTTRVN